MEPLKNSNSDYNSKTIKNNDSEDFDAQFINTNNCITNNEETNKINPPKDIFFKTTSFTNNTNNKILNSQEENNNINLDSINLSLKYSNDRKYNNENIQNGKSFFFERYIENQNKKKRKIKNNLVTRVKTNINSNFTGDRIKEMEEAIKKLKTTEIFSKKIDKSIFSFNLKNYDDCYNELLSSEIIFNESEFAEFLLVINGLDTFIIGDFLAKSKGLNDNFIILKLYMEKINFKGISFLNAIRFLLSRLNLPKDAGLILGIIDEFTKEYYKDNNPSDNYKDSNALYLLASTIFALNTMFIRKDIKNMNIIKKPEFIKMNSDCNKDYASKIYDELEKNPLDVKHDYHEIIYKRIAFTDKSHVKEENKNEINEKELNEYINIIKQGQTFIKYGNYTTPHERFFKLSRDEQKLIWSSTSSCCSLTPKKSVKISKIKDVYIGLNSSKVFEKYKIPLDYDQNCFSIALSNGSIDLRNESDGITKKWYYAIKFLIKRQNGLNQFKIKPKKKKNENNEEETIETIWRTEILIKWELYRKYLIKRSSSMELYRNISEQNKKSFNQKLLDMFKRSKNNNIEYDNLLNKSEFYHLWTYGIPSFLRKRIWPIIIGNDLSITENFVNHYLKLIEKIEFKELNKLMEETEENTNNKKDEPLGICEDIVLNEMLNDILKISNKVFKNQIKKTDYDIDTFTSNLFKIVRIFILYRQDVNYSEQLVYISSILLLNSENYFQAFVNLVNFIIPSCLIKFLKNRKDFIDIRNLFFTQLLEKYTPLLKNHLEKLEVKPSMYLSQWLDYVFIKAFNYKNVLRLWDIYLLKGEIFLYEIAISILIMEEKELLNFPVTLILENIKHIPEKYTEQEFFNILTKIDIYQQFKYYIDEVNVGVEKGILMQAYMTDKI